MSASSDGRESGLQNLFDMFGMGGRMLSDLARCARSHSGSIPDGIGLGGVDVTIVAVEQAQKDLSRLIDDVALGEHVVITRDQIPVAELVPVAHPKPKPTFGSAKGMVKLSDDFDAPIADFRAYVQ